MATARRASCIALSLNTSLFAQVLPFSDVSSLGHCSSPLEGEMVNLNPRSPTEAEPQNSIVRSTSVHVRQKPELYRANQRAWRTESLFCFLKDFLVSFGLRSRQDIICATRQEDLLTLTVFHDDACGPGRR